MISGQANLMFDHPAWQASTHEHLDIANAVKNHDRDRARTLMVDHIAKAEDRIVAALRAAGY